MKASFGGKAPLRTSRSTIHEAAVARPVLAPLRYATALTRDEGAFTRNDASRAALTLCTWFQCGLGGVIVTGNSHPAATMKMSQVSKGAVTTMVAPQISSAR